MVDHRRGGAVDAADTSMCRHVIFDIDAGDEYWLQWLARFGFSEVEIQDIYQALTTNVWHAVSAEPLDVGVAQALHEHTWSSVQGLEGIIRTRKGTLAMLAIMIP